MHPRDFHQFAVDVVVGKPPSGPAAYRSAISRAYYSAMNVAADLLASLGHSPAKADSKHKKIVIYFQESGDAELGEVARRIDDLRSMRNRADYDMEDTRVEALSEARSAVERAQAVIEQLGDLDRDPARKAAVAAAIFAYKAQIRPI